MFFFLSSSSSSSNWLIQNCMMLSCQHIFYFCFRSSPPSINHEVKYTVGLVWLHSKTTVFLGLKANHVLAFLYMHIITCNVWYVLPSNFCHTILAIKTSPTVTADWIHVSISCTDAEISRTQNIVVWVTRKPALFLCSLKWIHSLAVNRKDISSPLFQEL